MNVAEPFVRQALAAPERPALIAGPATVSYGELLLAVKRLAWRLKEAGVQRHDRVAIAVRPPAGDVALTLALAYIGAVSVGVSGAVTERQLSEIAQKWGIQWVVHTREADFSIAYPALKGQFKLSELRGRSVTGPEPAMHQPEPDEPWRIVTSSGTTGRPKGIVYAHSTSIIRVQLQRGLFPTSTDDRVAIGMSVAMGYAVSFWLRTLYCGACVILYVEGTPRETLEIIHSSKATQLVTTPATTVGMIEAAQQPGSPYAAPPPSLRLMNVGGAKVSPRLQQALRQHLCPQLYVNYGAAEMTLVALLDPQVQDSHPDAAGRLVPWTQAQAVDPDGQPLPPGSVGPLRFRSPGMCLGYVVDEHGPGELPPFRDGWFYSNDVGSVRPDGLLFLSGRANDVLNVSGVKVDPERVEGVIMQDPSIHDCVVVAVPSPDRLDVDIMVAVVVASGEVDAEALRQRCRAAIGPQMAPGKVLRAPAIPRNEAGKIMRDEVRRRVAAASQAESAAR